MTWVRERMAYFVCWLLRWLKQAHLTRTVQAELARYEALLIETTQPVDILDDRRQTILGHGLFDVISVEAQHPPADRFQVSSQ